MSKKKLIALVLCVACVLSAASPGSFATDDAQDETQVQAVETVADVPAAVEYDEPAENPTEDAQPVADSEPAQQDPATEETEPVEEAPAEEPVDPQPTEETDEGTEPAQNPEQKGESTDAQNKDIKPESGAEVDDTQDKTAQEPETSTDKEDAQETLDNDEEVAEEEETAEDDKATEDDKDDIKSLISKILEKLIGAIKVTVAGELPEDAQLVLGEGSKLKAETLLKQLVGDVNYVGIYSIDVDGADVGNTVEVTLDGLDIPQGKHVYVLHVLDSQEAIQAAIAANVENLLQSNNVLALLAAAKEAFLGGGYVYGITQEATVDGNSISFTTDSFSDFIVYTVDFHYDGYTYSIPGESSILLSELFDAIGFTAYTADYAESVEFSAPDLLEVSQNEDQTDWTLTSLAAFDTDETLTVTFKNGDTLELAVTDASSASTLNVIPKIVDNTGAASYTLSGEDQFKYRVTLTKSSGSEDVTEFKYKINYTGKSTNFPSNGVVEVTLTGEDALIITGPSVANEAYSFTYTVEQLSTPSNLKAITDTGTGTIGVTMVGTGYNTIYEYMYMENRYTGDLSNKDIIIGINNSYYYYNKTYGDAGSTHLAFPTEPSLDVSADFKRVYNTGTSYTDNSSWKLKNSGDAYLQGKASDYIKSSILLDENYEQSSISGDSTWGLYNADGSNTAYLKLTDTDYTAIITAWLSYMKNIEDDDLDKTTVDWGKATAAQFKVIPYVIKYQEKEDSGYRWVIDMVIVKRELVSLAYDLNVKAGYTISGTSQNIATKTYDKNTEVDVYTNPQTALKGLTVTKKVGNTTYTATFSHWEDEETGETFGGDTDNTKITMDKDRKLKAVWSYNEEQVGALYAAKSLVDSDGKAISDDEQEFTMQFNLTGTDGNVISNEYYYTIRKVSDGSLVSTDTSAKIKSGDSVKIKADQYLLITGLPKGATYTVQEINIPNGYEAKNNVASVTGTIVAGTTVKKTITNTKTTTAKLTITKSGMKADETAVFNVTGDGLDITVSVPNGGSITIDGLLIGKTYTVTEDTGWSWRYNSYSKEVTIAEEGSALAVENTTKNPYWLSGETHEKNVFGVNPG